MNYLPIVDRELRVAARRPGTWWWRLLVALVGIVVVETSLSNRYMGSPRGLSPGPQLFQALSALALVYALLAGLVYTADCISEERREGTLGLLFLTPLRGMDVVLGKLVATSLPGVYAMAAILPLLGLPVLLGGVTGTEMWQTTLLLLNTLFLSLAAGLLASAASRRQTMAIINSGVLILLIAGGSWHGALLWYCFEYRKVIGRKRRSKMDLVLGVAGYVLVPVVLWILLGGIGVFLVLVLPSPFFVFYFINHPATLHANTWFFGSLLATQLISWLCLVGAARLANQVQEEQTVHLDAVRPLASAPESVVEPETAARVKRSELLARNPVLWLVSRDPLLEAIVWILTFWLILGMLPAVWISSVGGTGNWSLGQILSILLPNLAIRLLWTIQTSRGFAEARRNGTLEVVLVTPLSRQAILQGQWWALQRLCWRPFLMLWGALGVIVLVHLAMFRSWLAPLACLLWMGIMIADFYAVGWVNLWLGWSIKRPAYAGWLTLLWVVLLPEILLNLALVLAFLAVPATNSMAWRGFCYLLFYIVKDGVFIFWARRNLLNSLAVPDSLPPLRRLLPELAYTAGD